MHGNSFKIAVQHCLFLIIPNHLLRASGAFIFGYFRLPEKQQAPPIDNKGGGGVLSMHLPIPSPARARLDI